MYLLDVKHSGFAAVETPQILQLTPNHREQISTAMRDEHAKASKKRLSGLLQKFEFSLRIHVC